MGGPETLKFRVFTLNGRDDLGNCFVDPIGVKTVQKVQTYNNQSRLTRNMVFNLSRLNSKIAENKS